MQILYKCRSSSSEIGAAHDLYSCFLCYGRLGSEISSASLDGSEFTSILWALKYTANRIEQNHEMMLHLGTWGFCWHLLPRTREARNCSPLSRSLITLVCMGYSVAGEDQLNCHNQVVREELPEE